MPLHTHNSRCYLLTPSPQSSHQRKQKQNAKLGFSFGNPVNLVADTLTSSKRNRHGSQREEEIKNNIRTSEQNMVIKMELRSFVGKSLTQHLRPSPPARKTPPNPPTPQQNHPSITTLLPSPPQSSPNTSQSCPATSPPTPARPPPTAHSSNAPPGAQSTFAPTQAREVVVVVVSLVVLAVVALGRDGSSRLGRSSRRRGRSGR